MYDAVQIFGSLLILAAFVAAIRGRLQQSGHPYLILNAIGSGVLAGTAIVSQEWGFVLLEGVWAIVSTYALVQKTRGQAVTTAH